MLEYSLVITNNKITPPINNMLVEQYNQRTILSEEDKNINYIFSNNHSILLGKYRYNYQGPYMYNKNNQFTCLVGYIVSSNLKNDKTNIVEQLHNILINNLDRGWLENCLGEFQIIHFNGQYLEILTSSCMTHPVYYRQSPNELCISNRASLTNLSLDSYFKPKLDPQTQAEIMAFDSILKDRTAFVDTKCLSRGYCLNVKYIDSKFKLILERKSILWTDNSFNFSNIREAYQMLLPTSNWFLEHLTLLPKQMNIDTEMPFNLSGGKDSRLLLTLFQHSGLMKYHSHVLTYGKETDGEVQAAKLITDYYSLEHKIVPRGVTNNIFFDRLPLHLYQLEGEINCRVLHGNYLGRRKALFTGHELGIKESFADTDTILNSTDLNKYIQNRMPFDPIKFLNKDSISVMYDTLNGIVSDSAKWNVKPSDFLTWFTVLGRGARWAGKLTAMSSPSGLYANLLCAEPIIKAGINIGVDNRKKELLHFAIMSSIDKDIIKYPFYNQSWNKDIVNEFKNEFNFPSEVITPNTVRKADSMWWDDIYLDNNKTTIKRIINGAQHSDLDSYIDYNKLFKYIDKVDIPSARAMLEIYSVISSNLLFHAGDITKDGMKKTTDIINDIKKDIEKHKNVKSFNINIPENNFLGSNSFVDFVKKLIEPTERIHIASINNNNKIYEGIFIHSGSEVTIFIPNKCKYSVELFCSLMPEVSEKADNQKFEIWCDDKMVFEYTNTENNRDHCNSLIHTVEVFGKTTFKVSPINNTKYGWCIFGIKDSKKIKEKVGIKNRLFQKIFKD